MTGEEIIGSYDINGFVYDENVLSVDLNLLLMNAGTSDVNAILSGSFASDINGFWHYDFNTFTAADRTYDIKIIATDENSVTDSYTVLSVVIKNYTDPPTLTVLYPNGNESFDNRLLSTITISVKIEDDDSNSFLFDLNYSPTNTEGSGTVLLNDENTQTSGDITCYGTDFSLGLDCNVSWSINAVADGNYFILAKVFDDADSDFDVSDNNFNIFTSAAPPDDIQRYAERYFNPNTRGDYTDYEKETAVGIQSMENYIFYIFLILVAVVVFSAFMIYRKGKR